MAKDDRNNGKEEISQFMKFTVKEIKNEGIAIDKENLLVLKARIDAILIDEIKPVTTFNKNKKKPTTGRKKS